MTRKIYIYIIMFFIILFMSFLLVNDYSPLRQKSIAVSLPYNNLYEDTDIKAEEYKEDNTIFELKYDNKIWKFYAKDFCKSNAQFDINYNLNKYKLNNNKKQKIKLINNLLKLKINKKIIINSVFPNFDKKILNIQNNIEKIPKNAYL